MLYRALIAASLLTATASAATKLDFNRDIRPILSDNCFACHGFDAKKRKADLRLDVAEGAYKAIDGAFPIKPGNPDVSTIIQRILTKDEDEVMPPPESNKHVSPAQVEILKRWIKEGAEYKKHWSFEAPVKTAPPVVKGGTIRNPIDAFIQSRLTEEKLTPQPEASKETLIRRVTLDLTGLPPTLAEVDAFLADNSPDAYEKVVSRLLKSERYGEHMGRYWLDAARYADTHGLHLDNERSMWPYRDWVVRAFNQNLPYDQFTIWQLAGDLLPNPTIDQQIASGFNRCNVTTSEGGSINEEFIFRYAVDRTESTVAVWMGLTAGCAVCHDHKFDPISQKEFYSLYAFFNSAADPAMDGNILLTPPILRLSNEEQKKQLAVLDQKLAATETKIRNAIQSIQYTDPATLNPPPPVQSSELVWFEDAFPAGAKVGVAGAPTQFVTKDKGPVFSGNAALKRTATGVAQDFFTNGAKYEIPPNGKISVQCYIDPANPPKAIMLQFHTSGWNHRAVWGQEGAIPFGQVRTPEKVQMGALPKEGEWVKLEVPAEKLGLKPGIKVNGFAFTQFDGTVYWDRLAMNSRVDPAKDTQWSWSKWVEKKQGTRVAELPNDLQTLVRGKKAAEWSEQEVAKLKAWWFENEYQGARSLVDGARAEKLALEGQKKTLYDVIPATFVMADLPEKRESFVMDRGQYDKPKDKVTRSTPAIFPPLPQQAEHTRMDLAKWLLSPQHPLTARVEVNRLWQQFFGIGLVKTSNDFGSQGEPPSHPELLDWLAVTFRESGWDMKAFARLIVTSHTYRQSAQCSDVVLQKDPENRLLARGPRFRLDAEAVRDEALFVSGLLSPKIGGKSVKPYQPENIWEPVGFGGSNTRNYIQDHGESLYRRSLYTFWKRTAPPPNMTAFDAPNRESYCLRRERSNTPLQALTLMNDVQFFEAARNFAQRVMQSQTGTDARITALFRTATGRYPSAQEAEIILQSYQKELASYTAKPEEAKKAISYGESKPDDKLNPAELAAWTMVANLVLNLDEVVTKG
ncbi:PSD1 and planctomycete cytochrome C domain-containing protein [Prosthecobacter vanneervenii]|uniref:Mono/diheme cytochrome c family protein n=1 Tax=Prosthecobacter vanneervenii TaxID=48466 RepID=A0A7W7YGA3_9BACT|nr:PSD1 and planctomycete cytochrome C domain-containing protein [Prosthecobacter vanneervenii]MBB5035594.1 mono/diheme cytochrome c family protein [Prosthecobacter vanneervenii]